MPIEFLEQEPAIERSKETKRPLENLPKMVPNSVYKLMKESWVKSLWEEVRKANEARKIREKLS